MAAAPERDDDAPGARPTGVPPGATRLGRLGRTFGLAGAQRCHAAGPHERELLLASDRLWVAGHGSLALRQVRPHGQTLLVAFEGIRGPERAQALVNADVYADPTAGIPPGAAARTVDTLQGTEVRLDGRAYGQVAEVHAGAQLLLLVAGPDGEYWVPGDAPYVRVEGGTVFVDDPPAGLLGDD